MMIEQSGGRKVRIPQAPSALEESFALAWRATKWLAPEREFYFAKPRRWRFDFAWPEYKVAVEVQGGIFARTRMGHSNGAAMEDDHEKYNEAQLLGWLVLALGPKAIKRCEYPAMVMRALVMRGAAQ